MTTFLQPRDEQDICDAVAEAAGSGARLEIVGGGSKRNIGHPHRQTLALSMASLAAIIDYDPAELVLTVQPGARLTEVEALLSRHNQMLAFEPYDFSTVVGGVEHQSTIGGIVGSGIAGSRRVSAGGVRDHFLGFSAVNGLGQQFKAGGKVVKNVTGYDLPKPMAGSWGQLAVLTELTLKVLPKPEMVRTIALSGLSNSAAVAGMTRAISSQAAVAAASHVPGLNGRRSITALRIEGFGPSVDARERMFFDLLRDFGAVDVLDDQEALVHWNKVRSAAYLSPKDRPILWRISIPPARGSDLLAAIARLEGIALLDWAGGLAWARTPLAASADLVRNLVEAEGGHAMLIDAPIDVRSTVPALHPEPTAVAALSKRVREAFDPAGVLDPQRLAAP